MTIIIKDGTGTGNTVKVNSNNRLFVNAITLAEDTAKAQEGEAFLMITGAINLTSDNESAVIYFQNQEERDVVVDGIGLQTSFATGSATTSLGTIILVRNPTGGTIISDAVDGLVTNRNYGSNNLLSANGYKGGEGKTMTGGVESLVGVTTYVGGLVLEEPIILPKGSSFGIKVTPPTDNTSADIYVGANIHLNGFNE